MKYAYVYSVDYDNPGDINSSVHDYFGVGYKGIIIDVFSTDLPDMHVDVLIIGGGALFTSNKFLRGLNYIRSKVKSKHTIVWGVGFDSNLQDTNVVSQFDLFSTREHKLHKEIQWVPCPSVLHPVFRRTDLPGVSNDYLVVDHFKRKIPLALPHTRIVNKPNSIHNIVEAISSHNYVITSSYHVMYWATLLKKKVFVIGDKLPTKFNRVKHFPVIASEFTPDLIDKAVVWDGAFLECVKRNYLFNRNVEEVTGIENPLQLGWMRILRN